MAVDTTPAKVKTPTRAERVASYKRDYRLRNPGASKAEGEQTDVDARVFADQMIAVDAKAQSAGNALTHLNQEGEDLDKTWEPRGIPRPQAKGSTGYVSITAATGGGPIFADDELTDPNTGLRFKCLETSLSYQNGDSVPVAGIDTGPETNLAVGTKLLWSKQRPGIGSTATVEDQGDGEGLSGGRDEADDDEYRALIADSTANPPAAGNDSQIQEVARKTPGVSFAKVFTYPAILGNGTTAVVGILKPTRDGASRKLTEIQRQELESWTVGQFPHGDIMLFPTTLDDDVDVALDVRWSRGVPGWADLVPWPARAAVGAGKIVVSSATNSTNFVLRTDDDDYTGETAPQANQTIGFYDATKSVFSRKRIQTVTGSGPWTIVCNTNLGVTDTSYVPAVGQPCCPWSDSLDAPAAELLKVFKKTGPGEMVDPVDFLGDGERQRRHPQSPAEWPSVLSNKDLTDVLKIPEIAEGSFAEGTDTATTVGTPGVTVYLMKLRYFTVFPA